jgi:hypothetical protein
VQRLFIILSLSLVLSGAATVNGWATNVTGPTPADAACIGSGCVAASQTAKFDTSTLFSTDFTPSTLLFFGLGLIVMSVVGRKIVRSK